MASCYWALLSLENFEFVYLPSLATDVQIDFSSILLSHSLLDFIHPDELALASIDLFNFVRIKTLAGAVTRCRLRSVEYLIHQEEQGKRVKEEEDDDDDDDQSWVVTDVVMYTATSNTILTFFHSLPQQKGLGKATSGMTSITTTTTTTDITIEPYRNTCCGSDLLGSDELDKIMHVLQQQQSAKKATTKKEEPLRVFQIYNTSEKNLLISWSNLLHPPPDWTDQAFDFANTLTTREMEKREKTPQLRSDIVCTHHSHSISKIALLSLGLCQVERIVITYGKLTFSSFQIIPVTEQHATEPYYPQNRRINTTNSYTNTCPHTIINRKSNLNKILNAGLIPTPSNSTVLSPEQHFINVQTPAPHDKQNHIPTNSAIKNNNGTRSLSTDTESSESTRLALPKAWKGKFDVFEKRCKNCQTNTSPEWRRGPSGQKTLCNACGLRHARLVAKQERQQQQQLKKDDNATALFAVNNNDINGSRFKNFKL